jgi:hypothetical protein
MVDQSIHPRVVGGVTTGPKVNTTKARNKDVVKRKIAAVEAHLERHPTDGSSRAHLDTLKGRL